MNDTQSKEAAAMHKRNTEIDILRAYSALMVFGLHLYLISCQQILNKYAEMKDKIDLSTGVDIFFVISGFVVSDAHSRISRRSNSTSDSFIQFISKRAYRLWPASAFWLVVCLILSIAFKEMSIFPDPLEVARELLAGLAYVYNFQQYGNHTVLGYFWSLSVEWQFYLLMPLLFMLSTRNRTIVCVSALIIFAFYRPGGNSWWMFRIDGLLWGIIIFDHKDGKILSKVSDFLISIASRSYATRSAITFLVLLEIVAAPKYTELKELGVSISTAFAFVLVLIAANNRGATFCILGRSIMNWIGLRSYSLYLCHIPVILSTIGVYKAIGIEIDIYIFTAITITATLIFSDISYRCIELRYSKHAPVKLQEQS